MFPGGIGIEYCGIVDEPVVDKGARFGDCGADWYLVVESVLGGVGVEAEVRSGIALDAHYTDY